MAITGGTGCLGQPLIEKLFAQGNELKVLVLPEDPVASILDKKLQIIIGSLDSRESLDSLTKDCRVVFHLAGKVHSLPKTSKEEREFYKVNVEGTKALLEAARINKVRRVAFYSTVAVYGKEANFHGDEDSLCEPISVYAKSKYQAEQLVLNSSNYGGPEGVVLRFPIVYGPLDQGNMAKLIRAIRYKYFFYFGDGGCLRSMISSKNAAEAASRAAFEPQAANQVFCVTDGKSYTLEELVETICYALNTNWRPFHIPLSIAEWCGKLGDLFEKSARMTFPISTAKLMKLSQPLTFSCENARKVLGYEPVETLFEGISREVDWIKKKRGWQ